MPIPYVPDANIRQPVQETIVDTNKFTQAAGNAFEDAGSKAKFFVDVTRQKFQQAPTADNTDNVIGSSLKSPANDSARVGRDNGQLTFSDKETGVAKQNPFSSTSLDATKTKDNFSADFELKGVQNLYSNILTGEVDLTPQFGKGSGEDFIQAGARLEGSAAGILNAQATKDGIGLVGVASAKGGLSYASGQVKDENIGTANFDLASTAETTGVGILQGKLGGPLGIDAEAKLSGTLEAVALKGRAHAESPEVKILDGLIGIKGKADGELNLGGIGASAEAGVETLDDRVGVGVNVGAGLTPLVGGKVKGSVEVSVDPGKAKELAGDAVELAGKGLQELNNRYGDDAQKLLDVAKNPGEALDKGLELASEKFEQGLENVTEKIGGDVDKAKDNFDTLSDAEKKFLSTNLHLASGFKDAADTADKLTSEAFDGRDIRSEDEVNAVRHAMWNALMVKSAHDNPVTQAANIFSGGALEEGVEKAKEMADAHEDNPKNTVEVSKNMDLHNNEVGRQVAQKLLQENPKATEQDIADAVLQAFRDGRMVERVGDGIVTAK